MKIELAFNIIIHVCIPEWLPLYITTLLLLWLCYSSFFSHFCSLRSRTDICASFNVSSHVCFVCLSSLFSFFPALLTLLPLALIDQSIRQTGIVKDDWRIGDCAQKLISVSPDSWVHRGLWPGPNTDPTDCLFAINMKMAPAKEYKGGRDCSGE